MTKRIQQLDPQTIAAIAAGEVVENPASVVKELCENALDAGADVIRVEITGGGIRKLRISDNGHGMNQDDALQAFEQHATSKLVTIEDLETIGTMGFRGEALASISAVARVTLETREPGESMGTRVVIHGGELLEHVPTGCREGTTITVEDLFYNVPARYKFLMKDQTEGNRVSDLLRQLALARPEVSFHLTSDRKEILHSPGNDDLISAVHALYGSDLASGLVPVMTDEQATVKVSGLISKPDSVRKSRTWQMFFVNRRVVRDPLILRALEDAYQTLLMKGRFPAAVLFLELPAHLVDVNVHPQKIQLRFWKKDEVYRAVYHQVKNSIYSSLGAATPLEEKTEVKPDVSVRTDPQSERSDLKDEHGTKEGSPQVFEEDQPPSYEQQAFSRDLITRDAAPTVRHFTEVQREEGGPGKEELKSAGPQSDPEQLPSQTISKEIQRLLDARLIGTIFNTYLLFESEDSMLLLDQHAAHEKILFEQKVKAWQERQEIPSQMLISPLTLRLAPDELSALDEAESLLHQIGYDWSLFGTREILLRAVPQGTLPELAGADFRDTLSSYRTHGPELTERKDEAMLHLLATASCKGAVKAHDPLNDAEIRSLLDQMSILDNPWHCPHGRPVVVKLSQTELERFFQRIVN